MNTSDIERYSRSVGTTYPEISHTIHDLVISDRKLKVSDTQSGWDMTIF